MYEAMSVFSITLTLLASLLIMGCASTGEHRHTLEDSHGFHPTPAYRVEQ
jgi:outer membrane biogenesis lipoprotein LolB